MKTVRLENLDYSLTKTGLVEILTTLGFSITRDDIRMPHSRLSGNPRGVAFCRFATDKEAHRACNALCRFVILGRPTCTHMADFELESR